MSIIIIIIIKYSAVNWTFSQLVLQKDWWGEMSGAVDFAAGQESLVPFGISQLSWQTPSSTHRPQCCWVSRLVGFHLWIPVGGWSCPVLILPLLLVLCGGRTPTPWLRAALSTELGLDEANALRWGSSSLGQTPHHLHQHLLGRGGCFASPQMIEPFPGAAAVTVLAEAA